MLSHGIPLIGQTTSSMQLFGMDLPQHQQAEMQRTDSMDLLTSCRYQWRMKLWEEVQSKPM